MEGAAEARIGSPILGGGGGTGLANDDGPDVLAK